MEDEGGDHAEEEAEDHEDEQQGSDSESDSDGGRDPAAVQVMQQQQLAVLARVVEVERKVESVTGSLAGTRRQEQEDRAELAKVRFYRCCVSDCDYDYD